MSSRADLISALISLHLGRAAISAQIYRRADAHRSPGRAESGARQTSLSHRFWPDAASRTLLRRGGRRVTAMRCACAVRQTAQRSVPAPLAETRERSRAKPARV